MKSKGASSIRMTKRVCQMWILEDYLSVHFRQLVVHKRVNILFAIDSSNCL